ncbi:MAG: DUF3800 domain-containing protein [Pseudomonadota bacterium]
MMQYTVYIDESGNAGDNLLDQQQPVFTLSGIGLVDSKISDIELFIAEKKKDFGIQAEILHARNLLRRNRHDFIEQVIEMLMQNGLLLFYSISERDYLTATHIEGDFFDYVYNDKCDVSWTHPISGKRERADIIFKSMTPETLNVWGRAFTNAGGFKDCYDHLLEDMKASDDRWGLGRKLIGFEKNIKEYEQIAAQGKAGYENIGVGPSVLMSPNYFSLYSLLNKIEVFFSGIDHGGLKIIFHSSRQFNDTFITVFNRMRNAADVVHKVPGKIPFVFRHRNASSFELSDSKNMLVQCADLIATSINNSLRKVYLDDGKQQYTKFDIFILGLIITANFEFGNLFSDWVISNDLIQKLLETSSRLLGDLEKEVLR